MVKQPKQPKREWYIFYQAKNSFSTPQTVSVLLKVFWLFWKTLLSSKCSAFYIRPDASEIWTELLYLLRYVDKYKYDPTVRNNLHLALNMPSMDVFFLRNLFKLLISQKEILFPSTHVVRCIVSRVGGVSPFSLNLHVKVGFHFRKQKKNKPSSYKF